MPNRRSILFTGALAAAAVASGDALADDMTRTIDPVKDWQFAPSEPLKSDITLSPTGLGPARNEEVSTAFRLLFLAPRDAPPLKVAEYFEAINKKNADGNPYNWEWPTPGRANPLIVGFFSMTNTLPSAGDQTSWCAAFVNFCLAVAGKRLTGSALSGSFRTYSTATTNPAPGDIVVFRDAGQRGKDGFGHVGFYVSSDDTYVEVLGGNQRGSTGSTGAVTRSKFRLDSPSLIPDSYRKVV